MRRFIVGIIVIGVMLGLPGCFGDRGRVVQMGAQLQLMLPDTQDDTDQYEPVG